MPPTYRNQNQQQQNRIELPKTNQNVEFQPGTFLSVPFKHSFNEIETSCCLNAKVDIYLKQGYSYHSTIVLTPTSKLLIFLK